MTPRLLQLAIALAASLAASPASAVDVTAKMTAVSDYRYRGITLSDGRPAAQGELSISHDSGLYLTAWGSTIKEPGGRIATEIDLSAGDEISLSDHLTLDLSGTYYLYPGDHDSNYAETTATLTEELGRLTASLGVSWAPRQRGTRDEHGRSRSNAYMFGELNYEIPDSKFSLAAHVGYERGAFDEVAHGGKIDWSLGADFAAGKLRVGLAYVGCNGEVDDRHTIVVAASLEF